MLVLGGAEKAAMVLLKKDIRVESGKGLGVLHSLVGKPSREQESCSALQLPSWLPLGHPPNPPGPCPYL